MIRSIISGRFKYLSNISGTADPDPTQPPGSSSGVSSSKDAPLLVEYTQDKEQAGYEFIVESPRVVWG